LAPELWEQRLQPISQMPGLKHYCSTLFHSFAERGLKGAIKSKPAAFYSKAVAKLVKTGNFDDDLEKLAGVDWVIEVVVENLEIKQSLLAKVEKRAFLRDAFLQPTALYEAAGDNSGAENQH